MRRLVILIGVTLAACHLGEPFANPDPLSYEETVLTLQAEARWKARPFPDYSYETRTLCFCPPEIARWTRVFVRGGAVVAVEAVEPDPNAPVGLIAYFDPIDTLFATLKRSIGSAEARLAYADITVEFDPVLGYPTTIHYQSKPEIADGGATYMVRNVRSLD
jgi:hypothetical protein